MNLWFIIDIALLLLFVVFVFRSWSVFLTAEGTFWQRLWKGVEQSATILWGYICFTAGNALDWSVQLVGYLDTPEFRGLLQSHLTPELVAKAFALIGLITLLARARSMYVAWRAARGGGDA